MRSLGYSFVELPREIGGPMLLGLTIAAMLTLVGQWLIPLLNGVPPATGILLAIVLGIPMFVCSTSSIPIAASLIFGAGLSPGAGLAFLIAGPATNAGNIGALWKVLGPRPTLLYLASIALCAFSAGMLLDGWFSLPGHTPCAWCTLLLPEWLMNASAIILLTLLINPLFNARMHSRGLMVAAMPGVRFPGNRTAG
jgi:hypothetical protein